ncbi:hypothetical protein HK096_010290 [Nowakowskiella sp. JEL0078]|nr:hypothetical protein HK096_010290 [Nowakowskiella sp. JEL0078]
MEGNSKSSNKNTSELITYLVNFIEDNSSGEFSKAEHYALSLLNHRRNSNLFSLNEDSLDEYDNSSLMLLNVDFLAAKVFLMSPMIPFVLTDRIQLLFKAKALFIEFLLLTSQFALLFKEDSSYIEAELGLKLSFDKDHSVNSGSIKRSYLPADKKRQWKIDNFKRNKELKTKLGYLRSLHSQTLSLSSKDAQDSLDAAGYHDSDLERDIILQGLQIDISDAIESLKATVDELNLLESKLKETETDLSVTLDTSTSTGSGWKTDGPLLSDEGRPLRPFVITSKRADLQSQVFRPHWNLPTMSIDEYLDLEMQRGNIISGGG